MAENYRAFLVVNPNSSGGRTGKVWPQIKELAQKVLKEFDFALTEGVGHATELARSALKQGYEMIVSVGGDGTNNEVVNGFFENGELINPEAVFAVVCSGTGSDFIKTAGIPRDFRQSIPMLAGKNFRMIDIGWMEHIDHSGKRVERYFINIASFGVGGAVDDLVNRSKKLFGGKVAFLWASFRAGLFYQNQPVELVIDGKNLERKIFNLAVANGRFFGAGMMVAPMAELDDGIFEVVILGDLAISERLKLSRLIYEGKHLDMPKIEHFQAKELVAKSAEKVLLDVDGEAPGSLPARFKILPKILRLKIAG